MKYYLYSGNRLSDGVVIYRGHEAGWSPSPAGLIPFSEEEVSGDRSRTLALLLSAEEARGEVVDPYRIEVREAEATGALTPEKRREQIRLRGPSARSAPLLADAPPLGARDASAELGHGVLLEKGA